MPNKVQCPCCGEWLIVGAERAPTFGFARGSVTTHERLRPVPGLGIVNGAVYGEPWEELRVEQPTREPTVAGDVWVPAQQALVSGVLAGALVLFPVIGWHLPWWVVPFASVCTTAGVWAATLTDGRKLLRRVEQISRQVAASLEPEPVAPVSAPAVKEEFAVSVITNPPGCPDDGKVYTGGSVRYANLPVSRAQFLVIAQAAEQAEKWSVRALAGKAGLSEPAVQGLLTTMLDAGLLAYPNGNKNDPKGAALTPAGRALVRRAQAAEAQPTPTVAR